VDGGPDTSVKQLAAALDKELRELIEAAHIDPYGKTIAGLLASHLIEVSNGWFRNPGLDFDGSPRMSVQRIRDEAALANRIACMLDPPSGPEALPTLQRIRAELRGITRRTNAASSPNPRRSSLAFLRAS
jgi:hypothetical protein